MSIGCETGLWSAYNKITLEDELTFIRACEDGCIERADCVLKSKICNLRLVNNLAFSKACCYGQMEIAKWLLTLTPNINIAEIYDIHQPFAAACYNGHLKLAKWLFDMVPDMMVSDINIYLGGIIFCNICKYGYLEMAKWFLEINPYAYEIIHTDDNKFIGRVLTKKDARWQNIKLAVWASSNTSPCKKSMLYKLPEDVVRYIIKEFI